MIAIINYGAGNIKSVQNALLGVNSNSTLISSKEELLCGKFSHAILPGVGAFGEAMTKLKERGLDDALREYVARGGALLGICLGFQLLFEHGYEFGSHKGLGLLKGEVVGFDKNKFKTQLKIPHMGWNEINFNRQTALTKGLKQAEYFYFVHSFHAVCDESLVIGTCEYGYKFVAAAGAGRVFGFQPHPEKSAHAGLEILKNFKEM